jgi:streptogramin lyase/mono/diheme cytochrome c family protein
MNQCFAARVAAVVMLLCLSASAQAQDARSPLDDFQRSYQMDRYTELAEQGAGRGEDLYFYKCFVCHNHYANGGPSLTGLFQHARLANGNVVNDQSVMSEIRGGAAGMPGFVHTLTDADLGDLLSYFKSTGCCYEADQPPANPLYRAASHPWSVPNTLRGGIHGRVHNVRGEPLEAIKVQLIAPNGVRTTVATDEDGSYEFPLMQTGEYLLRVATPLAYLPVQREHVRVEGNKQVDDLVLDKVPEAAEAALPGVLPPTVQIASQLSGSELLWNLPGNDLEKTAFIRTCGIGCHDLKEILRNRFDEPGWRTLVTWMTSRGSASAFMVRPANPTLTPDAELVVKWLARVRGPGSVDAPYRSFPRMAQASTHAVITEFELPRRFLSVHEVAGDSKGNIWYTSHRTPYMGMLDPRTGVVTEYAVPDIAGTFPGTYKVEVDRHDYVWVSQSWAHRLTRLDPKTGTFKQLFIETSAPLNAGPWGNFGLAPDGFLWSEHDNNTIVKLDPNSGKIVDSYPLSANPNPADDLISHDGRFWAGGAPTMGNNTAMILDITHGKMYETNSGDDPSSAARGGFDSHDNVWFGGHMGSFIEVVNEIAQGKGIHLRVFAPPTPYFPYSTFYTAVPDKNGDVWGAWVHGPGFVRFNPDHSTWRVYETPEPSAFARSTWVDNSTNPVSIWYPDYQMGTLVRIQARD